MPSNARPKKFIDPYRGNQSLAEIEDAQNQWDLLEEQEKANELAQKSIEMQQQRLYEEKENAEKIANATKRAEANRYRNELKLQQKQQVYDKKMRYMQLCDELGVVYEDLEEFNVWLNALTDEQREYYNGIVNKYKSFVYTDEIKKLDNKLSKDNEKLEELEEEEYEGFDEDYDTQYYDNKKIVVKGVQKFGYQYEGTEKEIKDDIQTNKQLIKELKSLFGFITILGIGLFAVAEYGFRMGWYSYIPIVLGILIDLYIINTSSKYKNGMKLMEQALIENEHNKKEIVSSKNKILTPREKLEKQIKQNEKKLQKMKEQRMKDLELNSEFQDIVPKYNEAIDALYCHQYPNKLKFNEFRYNHYNKEIEQLFRKMSLNIDKIDTNKVKNTGTVDDYVDYINNKLANEPVSVVESDFDDDTDSLLSEAIEIVIDETEVSDDFLASALQIDIERASNIMEQLEMRGIVSSDEDGCREVLMSKATWNKIKE